MSYFTADEIIKSEYLFVSYKHDDKDIVYGIVDLLISMGVRIWCDRDLTVGENWNERVRSLIEHENCKGALFFNSTSAFYSSPIARERDLIIEKKRKYEDEGKKLLVVPINIGKPSTMRLLKEAFELIPDVDSELEARLSLGKLNTIIDLFNNETLYCYATADNAEECANEVFGGIEKFAPGTIDASSIKLEQIGKAAKTKRVGGLTVVSFGRYKSTVTNILPSYQLDDDGIVKHKGETFIVDCGKAYTVAPMNWICLYCEGDDTVMISEQIIESRTGGQELDKWLNGTFKELAFDGDELDCLTDGVSLLSEKDISRSDAQTYLCATSCEYLSENQWWINAYGVGIMQKIVRDDGTVYKNGYNSRSKKCGVRPVIRVSTQKLLALGK